jgi:hypothetical protein
MGGASISWIKKGLQEGKASGEEGKQLWVDLGSFSSDHLKTHGCHLSSLSKEICQARNCPDNAKVPRP